MRFVPCSVVRYLHLAIFGVVGLLVVPSARAAGAGWDRTFGPAAVVTYLPKDPRAYLVAAATADAREAATAFAQALRAGKTATLVMDDAAIAPIDGLDDAAIAAKARPLPIKVVVVVRVFPGGPDEPSRAVVTLYESATAKPLGALSGAAGTPLEPNAEAAPAAAGVSETTSSAVATVLHAHEGESQASKDEYDRLFIFYDGVFTYQGRYRQPIAGSDLYRALGRDDLVKRHQSLQSGRVLLAVLALGAIGAGVAIMASGACQNTFDANGNVCNDDASIAGGGLVLTAGLIGLIPVFFPWNAVDPPELRQAIDQYDAGLRKRLGLAAGPIGKTSEESPPPAPSRARMGWSWGIVPTRIARGAGAALGATF
jgi:hypothetical protein